MKPKFSIGQIVYLKNPKYIFMKDKDELVIKFAPFCVIAITQYGVGTENSRFSYTVNFEYKSWRGFENHFNEDDLTDDVNDIFIMVHEQMKEHLDECKVAY